MNKEKLRNLFDRLERCVEKIEADTTTCSRQLNDIGVIIQTVADYYEISPRLLLGKCREQAYCWPRHVAAYFAKRYSRLPLQTIATRFGYSDHASVLHAVRRVRDAVDINDRRARQDIAELTAAIDSKLHDRFQQPGNSIPQFSEEAAETSRRRW